MGQPEAANGVGQQKDVRSWPVTNSPRRTAHNA